ncbi:MAG TPA: HAD-IIB family hydrolase, partial [Acidimicrobiia bacterium]|nr:HAD-IIB family hydrolase [Acidimicrobiia bacterium]
MSSDPAGFSIAAFDVDGTLADASGVFDVDALEVIADLVSHGILIVIATARGPSGLDPIVEALEASLWAVTYQGGLIGQFEDGRWVAHDETTLDIDVARQIADMAAESGLATSWHAGLSWYTTALTDEILLESRIVSQTPQLVEDPERLSEPPHKLMLISASDETWRLAELADLLPRSVSHSYSHPNYLEISPFGVDKGTGLDEVLVRVGGSASDLAAFGDGENDIPMFEIAGHSVAMAHAPESVRHGATTVASHGLVAALRQTQWRPFHWPGPLPTSSR